MLIFLASFPAHHPSLAIHKPHDSSPQMMHVNEVNLVYNTSMVCISQTDAPVLFYMLSQLCWYDQSNMIYPTWAPTCPLHDPLHGPYMVPTWPPTCPLHDPLHGPLHGPLHAPYMAPCVPQDVKHYVVGPPLIRTAVM